MRLTKNIFAALLLLLGIGLAGCGQQNDSPASGKGDQDVASEKSEKKLTVGFSQIGAESDWRTAETKSIRTEAEKRGINLKFSDAQQKQENQIKAIRAFIAQKVDAIVLAPVVETGWEPVLKEAKQAGIPVILADRAITVTDDSLYTTLVSPDMVEEGRMAARFLARKLGETGNIVELKGTPGSSPAIDRETGFHEVLAEFPEMKIIKSQTGDFTRTKGKEVMEAFLKAGDKIDAVYAHNDDMALGAIQAIEAAGLKPGIDIAIVSIDGVKAAFTAMIAGKLNATIECNPILGPAIFDAVQTITSGQEVPKIISSKEEIFEQDTAAEDIKTREY